MDTSDMPPARLPQCLELVGEEEDLQAYLKHNRAHLKSVRTVFLRGEEAQGKFVLGYFHQTKDIYTSKKDEEEETGK